MESSNPQTLFKVMKKKKLAILHTESSTGWAGQEMRIILESREMKKLGHSIIIAAQPGSGIIPAIDREKLGKELFRMNKKTFILSIIRLIRIISRYNIDIVNTHSSWDSWIASIAARISRRKPLILRTRHLSTPVSRGILSRIVYQYLPHIVITTGNSIRTALININKFPKDKIISVPTGVDLNVFYPRPVNMPLRKELEIYKGQKVIGIIAALRSWKGHDYLLEAIKLLIDKGRDIKLVIAGDGPKYEHLAGKASALGIKDRVLFLGYRNDIPDILSALDVVALPSYANEGVPQSILQAMAMGKPVVACNAGAISEIVQDGRTGILVEPRDPVALTNGIASLLDNNELVKTITANARGLVESKYSLKQMVDKMENIYYDLMQKSCIQGAFSE
jgi:glycosyltransferase involved in cell wall biosynthesis